MSWYVHQNGATKGPFPEDELLDQIKQGSLPVDVLICQQGMSEWKPAIAVFTSLPKLPSLPPPPTTTTQVTTPQGAPVVQITSSPKSVITASWILIVLSCLGSMIPALGFAVWIIIVPVLLLTFIFGILAISRGSVLQGMLILGATLVVVPLFVLIAPIVSTGSAVVGAMEEAAANSTTNP